MMLTTESMPCLAQGHTDWVFGITWVTEAHVVTVSRDQRVNLWHVDGQNGAAPANTMPLQSQLPLKVLRRTAWDLH
jgi:hypothetical protein